jgi:hypothetical protein
MASIGTKKGTEKAGGGITYRSIKKATIIANRLHADVLSGSYLSYNGKGQPFLFLATMAAVASGADTVEHVALLPAGNVLHYWPIGAIAQGMKGPQANVNGLRLDFDAAAGDGANYVPGGLLGSHLLNVERTAGAAVPEGKFIRWRGVIEDVSGATQFAVGFRKSEAIQAAIDSYADLAAIVAPLGAVATKTILATVVVNRATGSAAWADGEEHEILVTCAGNGKVAFYFDGRRVGIDFQFADDAAVVPFIFLLESSDFTFFYTKALEVGPLGQLA